MNHRPPPMFLQNTPTNATGWAGPLGSIQNHQQVQNLYFQVTGLASRGDVPTSGWDQTNNYLPAYYFAQMFQDSAGHYDYPDVGAPYLYCSSTPDPSGNASGLLYEINGNVNVPTNSSYIAKAWPRYTTSNTTTTGIGVGLYSDEWEFEYSQEATSAAPALPLVITSAGPDYFGNFDAMSMYQYSGSSPFDTFSLTPGAGRMVQPYKVAPTIYFEDNTYISTWARRGDVVVGTQGPGPENNSPTYIQLTTVSAAISAGVQTITPANIAGCIIGEIGDGQQQNEYPGNILIINYGLPDQETITVSITGATTFVASFALSHAPGATIWGPWWELGTVGGSGISSAGAVLPQLQGMAAGQVVLVGANTANAELVLLEYPQPITQIQPSLGWWTDPFLIYPITGWYAYFTQSHAADETICQYNPAYVYTSGSRPVVSRNYIPPSPLFTFTPTNAGVTPLTTTNPEFFNYLVVNLAADWDTGGTVGYEIGVYPALMKVTFEGYLYYYGADSSTACSMVIGPYSYGNGLDTTNQGQMVDINNGSTYASTTIYSSQIADYVNFTTTWYVVITEPTVLGLWYQSSGFATNLTIAAKIFSEQIAEPNLPQLGGF